MSQRDTTNHPVWDVYDELRTARLNVKYYGCCLDRIQSINTMLEIALAITAPSSTIAGLWFWQAASGKTLWQVLTIITAAFAVSKPFLRLADRIRRYEEILTGYRTLAHDLNSLVVDIRQKQTYSAGHRAKLREALERKGALIAKAPQAKTSMRLRRRCQAEIDSELPHTSFFIPEEVVS